MGETMIRTTLTTLATVAIATALLCGPPRFIGYGCTNPPAIAGIQYNGPRFAHTAGGFIGRCDTVRPLLPWYE